MIVHKIEECVHLIICLILRVQYFLRCEDADLSKLLNFFTFLPTGQIADLISSSDMSKRLPHKKLAGMINRVLAVSRLHVSTPKSFAFVLKSTINTKKWYLKMNNHPLI